MNLRVLFVDDSADDVCLMLRRLEDAGVDPQWQRVHTAPALREAIAAERWELALVDYNLPGFSGPEALAILAAEAPDLPAITVSGAISEETAVATITAGAVDYVLKGSLTRLAPAVLRAVEGAELRREQRRAAAQARETMYAIEHSSQAIAYVSRDGTILYSNAAAHAMGEVPSGGAIGQKMWAWSPMVDEQRWAELWRAASQRPVVDFEATMRLPGGEVRLLSTTLDYQERGDDSFVIVYVRDVTEQRAAEKRAAESEALYRRIVDLAGEGIWAFDHAHRVTFANRQMAHMLGCELEGMVGRACSDFVFPEDLAAYEARNAAREQGASLKYESRWRARDGSEVWLAVSSVADLDSRGRFVGSFAMCTDITERRRSEDALRESEERFRLLSSSTPDSTSVQDRDLRYEWVVNPALGMTPEDFIGKTDADLLDVEQFEMVRALKQGVMDSGDPLHIEVPLTDAQGKVTVYAGTYVPRRDAQGNVSGILSYFKDITERTQAETALAERERMLATLLGNLPGMAYRCANDERWNDEFVSDGCEELTGYSAEALTSDVSFTDLMHPDDVEDNWQETQAAIARDEAWTHTYRILTADGELKWVWERGVGVRDEHGAVEALEGFIQDVTSQKAAEAQLEAAVAEWRQTFDAMRDSVVLMDADGTVMRANAATAAFVGGDRDAIVGRHCYEVFHGDVTFHPDCPHQRSRRSLETETSLLEQDGRWLRVTFEPILGADGKLTGGVHVVSDVSGVVEAEQELRESESRFEAFAAHLPGYLFMHDDERRYVYVNRPEQIDGEVLRKDWFGKTAAEAWPGEMGMQEDARVRRALEGEAVDAVVLWEPSGLREYTHSIYFQIPRPGKPPLVGGLSLDVTAQVEAQEEVLRQAEQLRRTVWGTVLAMGQVVESRDSYTAGHQRRVGELAAAIARQMGMAADTVRRIETAGMLHDIGKVAVPAEILAKPGRLSEMQFQLIQVHPQAAYDILAPITFDFPLADIVVQHHERLDGSGYPKGLCANDILPEARILAVADVLEAMVSNRPYRAALPLDVAIAELEEGAGRRYEAAACEAAIRLVRDQEFRFNE